MEFNFYKTREWRELRYRVLSAYDKKCMCCNAEDKALHVDHVKPRSKYPELELDFDNLQVLCEDCNLGKSNKYSHDFRGDKKPAFSKSQKKRNKRNSNIEKRKQILNSFLSENAGKILFIRNIKSKTTHLFDGIDTQCKLLSKGGVKIKETTKIESHYFDGIPCKSCIDSLFNDPMLDNEEVAKYYEASQIIN